MGACTESVSHRFLLASEPTKLGAKRIKRAAEREHERAGWREPWVACVRVRRGVVDWSGYWGGKQPWFYGPDPLPDFGALDGYLLLTIDQASVGVPIGAAGRDAMRAENARVRAENARDYLTVRQRVVGQRARFVSSQAESEAMLDLVDWANRRLAWLLTTTHAIVYGGRPASAVLLDPEGKVLLIVEGSAEFAICELVRRIETRIGRRLPPIDRAV